jgi:molybdopterin converting factor small subunit
LITVELPRALCSHAGENTSLVLDEPYETVGQALLGLRSQSPAAADRIMDEQGVVRRHVNIFVDGENIRFLDGLDSPTRDGTAIVVLAAVSGG